MTTPAAAPTALPRRLSSRLARELIALSDPEANVAPTTPSAADAELLLSQAERHGVLPAVLRRLRPTLAEGDLLPIRERYAAKFSAGVALRMMLKLEAARVRAALSGAGIPAVMIKGLDFAENLYPDPLLRAAGDIDLIVPMAAMDAADSVLLASGYDALGEPEAGAIERKWLHPVQTSLMIEVQGNLVHPGSLGSVLSLGFDELCPDGDPAEAARPAARLVIAGMHAASSHHFELLRLVVDVLQAARRVHGAKEEAALDALLRRSGGRLPVVAALDLAARMFGDESCRQLGRSLQPVRYGRLTRWLIDPSMVMSMETGSRAWQSWRRSLFRELLKRSAGTEGMSRH